MPNCSISDLINSLWWKVPNSLWNQKPTWGISINNVKSIPYTAGPMAFWWRQVNLFVMFVKGCLFIELLCFVIRDSSRMLRRGAEWIWTLENNWILHDIHVLGTHPSLNIYTPKAMSKYLKHMLSYGAFDFPLMVWGEYVCWSFLLWFSADLMGESRKTWSGLGWSTSRQMLYSFSWRIWHIIKLLYLFIYHHNQSPLACSHIWKGWQ